MAKKVKCPTCGAKNAPDLRRCRVCTALINPEVAERRVGLAVAPGDTPDTEPAHEAVAPPPPPPPPDEALPDPSGDVGITIDVAPRNPAVAPPPPPEPAEDERFDPDWLQIDPPN